MAPPPRPARWPWPARVLPGWWLLGAAWAVVQGFQPNPYLVHVVGIPAARQPYDMASVAFTLLFMAVEAGLLALVVRPATYPGRAWGRIVGALVLALAWGGFMALTAMHAPPSAVAGIFWSLLTVPLLAGLLVWLEIRARYFGPAQTGGPRRGTIDPS